MEKRQCYNTSRAQSLPVPPSSWEVKTISAFALSRENEDFYKEWEVAKISHCHEGYPARTAPLLISQARAEVEPLPVTSSRKPSTHQLFDCLGMQVLVMGQRKRGRGDTS